MKCKLSEKCEFGNLCKDATKHDSLTVLGCSSFKTKKPLTNEEWLHTLNTEEKAFALETIIRSVLVLRSPMCHDVCNREFWKRWLKEIHNDNA